MAKIVQIKEKTGEKVLRQIAEPVSPTEFGSPKLLKILQEMLDALMQEHDGVAIAAPQIAVSKRIFLVNPIVFELEKITLDKHLIYINPVITKISRDKKLMEEGCLSVRPFYGKVRRSTRVTIEAYDEHGKKFAVEATGLLAQIFQHETDHLEGVVFIDKARDLIAVEPQKNE